MTERFADYGAFLDGDEWPSSDDSGAAAYVGDMAPQHCAAAIWKLKRWAFMQWADDMRNEQEWQRILDSRLYAHLASKCIAQDFADAILTPPLPPVALSEKKSARLLAGCILVSTTLDEDTAMRLGEEIAHTLVNTHYKITKVDA